MHLVQSEGVIGVSEGVIEVSLVSASALPVVTTTIFLDILFGMVDYLTTAVCCNTKVLQLKKHSVVT